MKLLFLCITAFLLFSSSTIQGQAPIWNSIPLEDGTNLKYLHTDSLGFIWGLSENGLFKYDGLNLVSVVAKHDTSGRYSSLNLDQHHNFIIGTKKGELIKVNPYSNKRTGSEVKPVDMPITYLDCNDTSNDCLILSYGNGVLWKTPNLDTFLTINNLLISNEVYAAVLDEQKAILATDQGIQIIEKKGGKFVSQIINKSTGLGDVYIPNVLLENGVIWATNFNSQLYKIDVTSLSIITYDLPIISKINGIKILNDSIPYIYNEEGIFVLESNNWIKKYPQKGNQEVLDIAIDKENNLWAVSGNNTLLKANLGFQLIENTIGHAQAILKIGDTFWIGSADGLFLIEGSNTIKVSDKNVTSLQTFNDDVIVGTFSSGIQILSKQGEVLGKIDGWENNPNQSVLYITIIKDMLYVSSLTGVAKMRLLKNNGTYKTHDYQNLNTQLGPGYVYQILESNGDLFFATDRQGIKIISNDTLNHRTHFENGNTLGSIYSMTKCDAGKIWFSSSIGYIGYVEDGKIYHIDNERILQDPYISLISTPNQKIVMVRNSSIDIYDTQSGHFIYYNDILQSSDQELYLNCFNQEGNSIWLAKSKGIIKIDGFDNLKPVPEIMINEVMVNLLNSGNQTSFEEDQNNMEFKYSAAWMTAPERITYQYKLDGLDDNWRTTRDQSILYPMLRPGKYKFKIKASQDGKFSNVPEQLFAFEINKPFYKTWWFLILSLLIISFIVQKWRNERIKAKFQKEALKKKGIEAQLISLQTQLNPHFLFNSFNTLIGLIEEDPSKGIIFTEKLTDFYRNILEISKNDLIPLNEEIKLLETYIHLIKERFGEQLKLNISFEETSNFIIPPLTLQLLIENAVKHNVLSTKNPLLITIKQNKNIVTISNKLLPKFGNSKGTGIGLSNIKKRHTLNNLNPPTIEKNDTHFIVKIFLNPVIV